MSNERYLSTITGVIRDLASHDDMVVIGRGSQVILGNWPGAVHVLLVAPFQYRLQQYARREGLDEGEAARRAIEGDKARLAFHRKFFKVDADDPSLYHLTLNAERVSIQEAGQAIAGFAKPG